MDVMSIQDFHWLSVYLYQLKSYIFTWNIYSHDILWSVEFSFQVNEISFQVYEIDCKEAKPILDKQNFPNCNQPKNKGIFKVVQFFCKLDTMATKSEFQYTHRDLNKTHFSGVYIKTDLIWLIKQIIPMIYILMVIWSKVKLQKCPFFQYFSWQFFNVTPLLLVYLVSLERILYEL